MGRLFLLVDSFFVKMLPLLDILFHDVDIIVVNKPSGMRVIPDGYNPSLPNIKSILSEEFGTTFTVHRLDKETSGVLIFARNASSHKNLNEQFANRMVKKIYHAIILGNPSWKDLHITSPIRINGDRRHRTVIDPIAGKPARTDCTILNLFPLFTLLQVIPYTGYTHQIRAHLASIGYPLLGDILYGYKPPQSNPFPSTEAYRLALHAFQITFSHPATGELISFTAPYPSDFAHLISILKHLGNISPGKHV